MVGTVLILAALAAFFLFQAAVTISKSEQVTVGNVSVSGTVVATGDTGVQINYTLPQAFTGTLTTRTSGTVGTLTMQTGHTITTGALLDIYVGSGSTATMFRGATVGTVAGNSVPFTLASGTLPALNSAVTASVPTLFPCAFATTNLQGFAAGGTGSLTGISLQTSGGTEEYGTILPSGAAASWVAGDGSTNPISASTIAQVYASNGDATQTSNLNFVAVTN